MKNFIVSARKYRPQTFDTVVGQHSITGTLKNAIKNNHLAQAFLFCGPRGVGKTTCARILAKTINCENVSDSIEACNKCESCVSFNQSASFNIHELDAASNNSVDDIRNLVDQVRIPPQVGKYKVYIIDEVHMLSQAAFNAFLKTLEEPPEYAKFILATTEKHKIIPTILSRCQIYDFKRITVDDIAKHLAFVSEQEEVIAEQDALHIIAQKSDGALRDALSVFDQIVSFSGKNITYKNVIENLNVLDYDYYFKITDAILNKDIVKTLLIINEIIDNGFDGQHFIIGFGEHLRNILVCQDQATIKLLEVGKNIKGKYQDQSQSSSLEFLIRALDINNKCDIDYKSSNNKKLHLELALMQMCSIGNAETTKTVKATLPVAEKPKEPYKTGYTQKKSIAREPEVQSPVKRKPENAPSGSRTIPIKIDEKEKPQEKIVETEDLSNKPADEFTQEQVVASWNIMAEKYKPYKNRYSTLTKYKPVKAEDLIIEYTVDNEIQKKEIEDRKVEILPVIRQNLNNYRVQLRINVIEQTSNNRAYFPEEKFNKMAEKNPALVKLKNQLGLDLE